MLVKEEIEMNNEIYVKTYSDAGMWIRCGNEYIGIAIDPKYDVREYVETDIPVTEMLPQGISPETEEYAKAGKILMGVE